MREQANAAYEAPRPISAWLIFSLFCPLFAIGGAVLAYCLVTADPRYARGFGALASVLSGVFVGVATICLFTLLGIVSLWVGARRSRERQELIAFSILTNGLLLLLLIGGLVVVVFGL